jgi:hypothetical protein
MESVAERIAFVRSRIAAAAARVGRDPASVRLIAVGKGHPASLLAEAAAAGCIDLGENYVQEMLAKMEALGPSPLRWHMIGPLQRNKVRQVVGRIALLHTLDGPELASELERRGAAQGVVTEVLCQVDIAGETQKSGVAPENLGPLLEAAAGCAHLKIRGLMTLPPFADDPEETRPHFRSLRKLRDEMADRFPALDLSDLSMGMSGDFEVAVEEGATWVRIGTTIFGERPLKETKP